MLKKKYSRFDNLWRHLKIRKIRTKLIISYLLIILLFSILFLLPIRYYLGHINSFNAIMNNITLADDAMDLCSNIQKQLKDALRDYTRNPILISDPALHAQVTGNIETINNNIARIKVNNSKMKTVTDRNVLNNLDAYERMLHTFCVKATIVLSQEETVSLADRSESYEQLLIYKDAVESGKNDFISSEIAFSDQVVAQINRSVAASTKIFIVLLLVVLGLCTVYSLSLSSAISDNIGRITDNFQQIAIGNFDVDFLNITSNDELAILGESFNHMVIRFKELMENAVQKQALLRSKELEVLQAQINPHFLYNTLDSTVRMVAQGKNNEAAVMINSLSNLFRISLSKGNNIITIEDELAHVRNYLIIQSYRFKDKFRYEITADPDVLKHKTLKLILQPIVENAIYHGVADIMEEGFIHITAAFCNDKILLSVSDNGLGIRPQILAGIFEPKSNDPGMSGVALNNVYERLHLFYGDQAEITINSVLDEGTTVNILLPLSIANV